MNLSLRFDTTGIDWFQACEVFRRAPLGIREPAQLRRAFENSAHVCFAFHHDRLVGLGRALSDGEYQAVICDLVVLPEYQGKGVGRQILTALQGRLAVRTTILYAVPGKEAFYRNFGFARMRTAMARRVPDADDFREKGYIE